MIVSIASLMAVYSNANTSSKTVVQTTQENQAQHKFDPQAETDKMATNLGLSEDQKSKVLTILTDVGQKKEDLRTRLGDNAKNSSDWKAMEQDKDNRLKAVLTDAQYKKHLQMKNDMKQKNQSK